MGKNQIQFPQIGGFTNKLFTSEPVKLGKHYWRVVVWRDRSGRIFTGYEWVQDTQWLDNDWWRIDQEWHKYDFNHRNYGLPKGLAKLYQANLEAIQKVGGR